MVHSTPSETSPEENNQETVCDLIHQIVYDSWLEVLNSSTIYGLMFEYRKLLASIQSSIKIKGHRDIVTSLDVKLNEALIKRIRVALPDFSIETEEPYFDNGTNQIFAGSSHDRLIIDPLDGTTNAAFLQDHFSTAIVLVDEHKKPKLSVIFNPLTREFFDADNEIGARCNGIPISVNSNSDGIVIISDGSSDRKTGTRLIKLAMERGMLCRIFGSAQLDMCQVASGKAIGYMKTKAPDWDSLAGSFLVEMAGGKASLKDSNVVVSNGNPKIHEQLLDIMRVV